MAVPQQNGILMHGEPEFEGGCGCFQSFCWSRGPSHNRDYEDQSNLLPDSQCRESQELWIVTQLKKLREVSELLAGPKWKNFVRKIGSYFNTNKKRKDFRYDSYDYTLNFDNGIDDDDEDGVNLGFSSRFAPPVQDKTRL